MGTRKTIRKILFILFWVMTGAGLVTLLVAAISKKNKGMCKGYTITINGGNENFFIDQGDITSLLTPVLGKDIKKKNIAEIDLGKFEKLLRDNIWIREAELWIDSRDILHISVFERQPVARVFPVTGSSFYLDEELTMMPVSDRRVIRLPVFTGFPDKRMLSGRDSILLTNVLGMAQHFNSNQFWKSQVAQVNIDEDGELEMIPVMGNHIVRLGDGADIESKLNRLMIFYKQVFRHTGFDHYSVVDVQYNGQVIGTRDKQKIKVDIAALRKNVETLIQKKEQPALENSSGENKKGGNTETITSEETPAPGPENETKSNIPNSLKTVSLPDDENKKNELRIPKAVMPKRDTTNHN